MNEIYSGVEAPHGQRMSEITIHRLYEDEEALASVEGRCHSPPLIASAQA